MKSINEEQELVVEECNLYRPEGFITLSLVQNNEIGRLCAIRKLDQSQKRRLFFVEFYNTINLPHVTLEWRYPIERIALETAVWMGQSVVVGCSDGKVMKISPFKRDVTVCITKRFKIIFDRF
jgi:hypothetical protein